MGTNTTVKTKSQFDPVSDAAGKLTKRTLALLDLDENWYGNGGPGKVTGLKSIRILSHENA